MTRISHMPRPEIRAGFIFAHPLHGGVGGPAMQEYFKSQFPSSIFSKFGIYYSLAIPFFILFLD